MSGRPIAVVTGASAGVGRVTARAFAERGYDVALLARGEAGLEAAAKEVDAAGGRALVVPADVARWDEVDAAASRVEEELGPIAVWVNNAMTTVFARVWDCTPTEIARATDVTYLGQVHGTLAALGRMRPRDRGRIVNVGSSLSFVGIPLQSAYCGAKFAVRGFTESVRAELQAEGSHVTVSLVHLPAVNTTQFGWCKSRLPMEPQPVPPIYQPELCARIIVGVARDGRRSKLIGSWNKVIVAGAKVMPSVIGHYAARTGVASQQTDEPASPDRPSNLFQPVDDHEDHGAHGAFGERAHGVVDPSFRASLPATLATLGRSFLDAGREKVRTAAAMVSER